MSLKDKKVKLDPKPCCSKCGKESKEVFPCFIGDDLIPILDICEECKERPQEEETK